MSHTNVYLCPTLLLPAKVWLLAEICKKMEIDMCERQALAARIKRGDLQLSAEIYETLTGKKISVQYMDHFIKGRRKVRYTGKGKHKPTEMYQAILSAIEATNAAQERMASVLDSIRANVAHSIRF